MLQDEVELTQAVLSHIENLERILRVVPVRQGGVIGSYR